MLASRSRRTSSPRTHTHGFTIIELLIVIVVIAILAALSIVTYTGIQNRARETAVQADLSNMARQLGIESAQAEGSYPSVLPSLSSLNSSTSFIYTTDNGDTTFCLTAYNQVNPTIVYNISSSTGIQAGACTGHVVPGGSNPPVALMDMQDFTSQDCQALTVFTGSNQSAVVTLHDPRGTGQDYEVAKLADNRCWMIENLRLGSTSGTTPLTPSDTNISANWTLPQVAIPSAGSYDQPQAIGPIPGDTGSAPSATNHGYLYNFCAATAGGTASGGSNTCTPQATMPQNGTRDICATGWRLPVGSTNGEVKTLDIAFGGTGVAVPYGPSVASWQSGGPFKGGTAGIWSEVSFYQGSGFYRTSSVFSSAALDWDFGMSQVQANPASNGVRTYGESIRCILN
jgi:prepilin-type N-terminal cleavage/methylation domain-containing protein